MPDILIPQINVNGITKPNRSFEILPKTARTASGVGDWVDIGAEGFVKAMFEFDSELSATVTPTLDVKLVYSSDKVARSATLIGTIFDVPTGAFTQVTDAADVSEEKLFSDLKRYVRPEWTITGASASFAFGLRIYLIGRDGV